MSLPLAGNTIALAEGRQLEELAALLEKEGATILRCPMLSILDAPEAEPVVDWLKGLIADRFQWLVLLTGEGLRDWLASRNARHQEEAIAAFGRVKISPVARSPARR